MIDFSQYRVLSFDCYGTLIDWEGGIIAGIRPVLAAHNVQATGQQVLRHFAEAEASAEAGGYVKYREVLRKVVEQMGRELGFTPSAAESYCLADSLKDWMPFPDTLEGLSALKQRFQLAIISNIDDDLFAASAKHLEVEFDWVITSEQLETYKPSPNNFKASIERIGLPRERILHVAESIYHDVVPAKVAGLSTVWVNRSRGGTGATPTVSGQPDLEVPDLKTLVSMMGAG